MTATSSAPPAVPPAHMPPRPATRRPQGWSRADMGLAVGALLGGILSSWLGLVAGLYGDRAAEMPWALAVAVAVAVPLAFRRRYPNTVLVLVALAFFVGNSLRVPDFYVCQIALFIAYYTVGAWDDNRRRASVVRVVVMLGMFVWLLVAMFREVTLTDSDLPPIAGAFSPFAAYIVLQLLVNIGFFGGAYYLGDRAYANALSREALETRTAELERERELTGAQAVALDRVRIARELHDVVAHHVSAMGVQAGAARTILDRDPDAARAALVGIEDSARSAISDLRQLLETLRTPDSAEVGSSTVRLDAIGELVEHANANGLPTTLLVVGDPQPVSDLVQVNLYRIAQEALTNARRHGGPEATADVRLRYTPRLVELEVGNTGRAPIAPRSGLGLVGMRERASASGGSIEMRGRTGGGFLVRVSAPITTRTEDGA